MSDTSAVLIDGQTKAEVVEQAATENTTAGTLDGQEPKPAGEARPGEPQRVLNSVDRARQGDGIVSSLASQEETEAAIREARGETWTAWTEPESLAEQAENTTPAVHAADDHPGGRLAEDATVELAEEEVNVLEEARRRADEERLDREKEVERRVEAQRQAAAEPTGVTGTDAASSSDSTSPTGPTGDTAPKATKAPAKKAPARKRTAAAAKKAPAKKAAKATKATKRRR